MNTMKCSVKIMLIVFLFAIFNTGQVLAEGNLEIIDVQPITEDGASSEGITVEDSFALKGERVMQEAKDETRTEISASFSNIMAINDRLTQSNKVTPEIVMQQELAEKRPNTGNEPTATGQEVKSGADQPAANRRQSEEQTQTVVTTNTLQISPKESFESNEQAAFQKDTILTDEKSAPLKTNDFLSEQKSEMVREAKMEDKGTKETEDAEKRLDDSRLLTSAEKSNAPIGLSNAYPAVLFRDYTDERITTTSLLHYLEGSGHPTLFSPEVEQSIEEAGTSSGVQEDPSHLGVGEEPSGKVASSSFRIDEPPRILSEGEVKYPFRAKRLGLTGKVSVSFWVNTDGQATNIKAVKAEPENALVTFAGAAEEVIANSRFKPGISGGEPVPVKVRKEIRFEIL